MVQTRTRKIYHDILSRKGRTALVVLSIMVGVFGVTVMLTMSNIIADQLQSDLKSSQISHNHVYLAVSSGTVSRDDNLAYLEQIKQLPNVVDAEGQAVYPIYWQEVSTNHPDEFTQGFMLSFTERFGEADLEPVSRTTKGRYPNPGVHEIAVEQRFADNYGIEMGDTLRFRSNDPAIAAEEWTVVGFVLHPYFTISPFLEDQIDQADSIYANYEDAQHILDSPGITGLHVRYTSVKAAKEGAPALQSFLASETPYVAVFNFFDDPNNNFLLDVVTQVTQVFGALGVIAMVVSGFLVTNVINSVVVEQRKQIGVMKSLGATVRDNIFIYTGMALVYGIIGTFFGILIGAPLGGYLAQVLDTSAMTYVDGIQISTSAIMVGIVMGLLVPVLAALLPVLNGTRVTILEAMTDLGLGSQWGSTRMSHWIGRLPLPRTVIQALSNIWQKRGRLTLTGLALLLAVAAFMGTTAVVSSLQTVIDDVTGTAAYEIGITTLKPQDPAMMEALIMDKFPEVEAVYLGNGMSIQMAGYKSTNQFTEGTSQVETLGLDTAHPAINFELTDGDGWQNDPQRKGVIVSRTLADSINKGVGDSVTLIYGNRTLEMDVIGINDYPFDELYMDWRDLATLAGYVNAEGQPQAGRFFVVLKGHPTDAKAIDKIMEPIGTYLAENGVPGNLTNQVEFANNQTEQISVFGVIFNATSGIMGLVGAIGLVAALSMAVYERQREIGVMRSVGAGSSTIVSQFMVEGITVGVLAWLVAAPVSFGLGYSLNQILPFDYVTYQFPPTVLLTGFVGVVLIAGFASLWPSLAASRKTVSDILRYQ